MSEVLTKEECIEELKCETSMHARLIQAEKTEMTDRVRSAIILCLRNKVLKEVILEKTSNSIWENIELLYMTKSLTYRLCLKQQLYLL